jgi:hypothetical protein
MSGRSLRPSRPQLRPAFACDRAGTARRADPRCSPSSHETLGQGQRLHPPVWPLVARTLRRHGSFRPRGGVHHHPLCRGPSRVVPPSWVAGVVGTPPCTSGGGNPIRQAGASGNASGGYGSPSGRPAAGYRWRGFLRTARGPTAGRPCSVAAGGVSARRERGRASDERPHTRLAKQSRHGVRRKKRGMGQSPKKGSGSFAPACQVARLLRGEGVDAQAHGGELEPRDLAVQVFGQAVHLGL